MYEVHTVVRSNRGISRTLIANVLATSMPEAYRKADKVFAAQIARLNSGKRTARWTR